MARSEQAKLAARIRVANFRKTNPDYMKEWRAANKVKIKKQRRAYYKKKADVILSQNLLRSKKLRDSVPSWADRKLLQEFVAACPEGYHVDHIIPLRGKSVSGFTVLENLQYLPAAENLRKSNKIEEIPMYPCCLIKPLDMDDGK